MKIILGSSSPRRRELMELIGMKFDVITSNADETFIPGLDIKEQSKRLAYIKAKAVFDETEGDRAVIGSDTMVLKNDKIYGKPHSREEATNMLKDLRADKHQVITSICVISQKGEEYKEQIDYNISDVYVKSITDEEIKKWVDSGLADDKAGGYAVYSEFGVHIEKIDGDFFSVMGLSIQRLYDMLKNI